MAKLFGINSAPKCPEGCLVFQTVDQVERMKWDAVMQFFICPECKQPISFSKAKELNSQ